ncbi:environmental stress-induced protein Ves [Rhodanobacter sp. TND4EL1]
MIIRLADCPSQPWKNGLGRTREIAVHPAGAGIDDFRWRVSIAEVDSGAPFSLFPGIDRQIVLLDGEGFTMMLGASRVHALTTPFVPFAFAGEDAVTVTLNGGPTRDFNLMVRRAQASSELQVCRVGGRHPLDEGVVLVYCARGEIETVDGILQAGDSWLPGTREITLAADAVAFIIRVT